MDVRVELQKNDRLIFPGMECIVESCVGRGSNVIAYTGYYRDHQNPDLFHRVLIRELFPFDPNGRISRDTDGSIRVEPSAQADYDLNRMTFIRGNEVHLRLLEKIPSDIDLNINTFSYNNTLYSLVGYTGGRGLDEDLKGAERKKNAAAGAGPFTTAPHRDAAADSAALLRIIRIIKGALLVLQEFHGEG